MENKEIPTHDERIEFIKSTKGLSMIWWEEIMDQGRCEEFERKYGLYGHDIGTTSEDIEFMYKEEIKPKYKIEGSLPKDNKDGTYSTTPVKVVEVSPNGKETVEEASSKAWSGLIRLNHFKVTELFELGAKWKEQQLADEAIEFANWLINKKYIIHKDHWMRIEDGEIKYYSSEQLYEIWNSRK